MSETMIEAGFVPLLRDAAQREGGRVFSRFEGAPLTVEALHRRSDALAAGLRRLGLARGARVAVMLRNGPAALATMFALGKAGIVWVPVNVRLRGDGLRYVLTHSGPDVVIADADLVEIIRASGADAARGRVLAAGGLRETDPLEPMLREHAAFDEPPPEGRAPFAISYTSGTTGTPKGVIVTHRMMRLAGEGAALAAAARDGDVLLVWEPLYHIGGSQLIVLPLIRHVTLAMVDRFRAARFWHDARDRGATHIHYLGGVLQMLLKQPPGPLDRSHGVRVAWGGGCPPDVRRACRERFGMAIRECYGMTEASSITTYDDAATAATVGRAVPWFTVDVRSADGRRLGAGERGEITVRERQPGALFPGYFRDPEATRAALRDGELHTGDVGAFDREGNLIFHGRATDSVRRRGEHVSAWEVEHVAAEHPGVEDCAMVGVAAEIGEQEIKLFVQFKPGGRTDPAELSAWLAARLASYQLPRYIAVVEGFERTPSHRIAKGGLSRETADSWDRLNPAPRRPVTG